jgi:uncharacterized protein (TIGR03382 family)
MDPAGGLTITVMAATATKATVKIDITGGAGGQPTCMDGTTTVAAPGPQSCGEGGGIVISGGDGGVVTSDAGSNMNGTDAGAGTGSGGRGGGNAGSGGRNGGGSGGSGGQTMIPTSDASVADTSLPSAGTGGSTMQPSADASSTGATPPMGKAADTVSGCACTTAAQANQGPAGSLGLSVLSLAALLGARRGRTRRTK